MSEKGPGTAGEWALYKLYACWFYYGVCVYEVACITEDASPIQTETLKYCACMWLWQTVRLGSHLCFLLTLMAVAKCMYLGDVSWGGTFPLRKKEEEVILWALASPCLLGAKTKTGVCVCVRQRVVFPQEFSKWALDLCRAACWGSGAGVQTWRVCNTTLRRFAADINPLEIMMHSDCEQDVQSFPLWSWGRETLSWCAGGQQDLAMLVISWSLKSTSYARALNWSFFRWRLLRVLFSPLIASHQLFGWWLYTHFLHHDSCMIIW